MHGSLRGALGAASTRRRWPLRSRKRWKAETEQVKSKQKGGQTWVQNGNRRHNCLNRPPRFLHCVFTLQMRCYTKKIKWWKQLCSAFMLDSTVCERVDSRRACEIICDLMSWNSLCAIWCPAMSPSLIIAQVCVITCHVPGSPSLPLSLSPSLPLSLSPSLPLSLSPSLSPSLPLSLSPSLPPSLPPSLSPSLSLSLPLSLSLSLSLALALSLSLCLRLSI